MCYIISCLLTIRKTGFQQFLQLKSIDCLPVVTESHEHRIVLLEPLGVPEGGGGLHQGGLDDGRGDVHRPQLGGAPGEDPEGEGALRGGLEGGGEDHVGLGLQAHPVGDVARVRVLRVQQGPVAPEIRAAWRGERERLLMKVFSSASPGLITDAVRLGREGVAGEPDDLGLRDAVLGEGEHGRVLGREV